MGWITARKNLGVLLAAFERLCARGYDGRLVLVGRRYNFGDDDAFERALAASPYRERVVLAGMAPDEDLPALYSGADLVIFPSLYEGFGIVPVEAMACGAPLIASSAGALPEVVGEGGVLVADPTDAAAFAAEAERLLSDPAQRAAQGARGLAWSRRYSASEAAEKTLAVYERVLSAS